MRLRRSICRFATRYVRLAANKKNKSWAVICAAIRASGERTIAVTERIPQAPLRVTERSLIARERRHGKRLGPGGEDGEIGAFFPKRNGQVISQHTDQRAVESSQSRLKCRPFLPGDLWYFPSLESTKHHRMARRRMHLAVCRRLCEEIFARTARKDAVCEFLRNIS